MKQDLVIIGTGKTSEVIYEYLKHEYNVIGFAEDRTTLEVHSLYKYLPVFPLDHLDYHVDKTTTKLFTAISFAQMNNVRTNIYRKMKTNKWQFITYIHTKATVAENVYIGDNCIVMEENNIQSFTNIGNNNIIWAGNHIGHHTNIGNNNFISSHVVISGNCNIGNNNFFGVNSTIGDSVTIGNYVWFSPCTMTIKDISDYTLLKGPKPVIHEKTTEEFFNL